MRSGVAGCCKAKKTRITPVQSLHEYYDCLGVTKRLPSRAKVLHQSRNNSCKLSSSVETEAIYALHTPALLCRQNVKSSGQFQIWDELNRSANPGILPQIQVNLESSPTSSLVPAGPLKAALCQAYGRTERPSKDVANQQNGEAFGHAEDDV